MYRVAWLNATLCAESKAGGAPDTTDYQNVNWTFEWTPPEPGFYVMKIRSVNDQGEASPESARVEIEVE